MREQENGAFTSLAPGHRLHDYELLCRIGQGGMAAVWIARLQRQRGFEKLVAIKTILPALANEPRFQEMFFDEARIASSIEHPNVAHIHDLGDENGTVFLVMEYIEGHALTVLRKAIHRKHVPFPLPIAARILADACAGLHGAHELRGARGELLHVIHRDVSPQNIFVSTLGLAKVIDFGVAKAANRVVNRTETGDLKGKLHYMAPEQALGREIDRRADIWSVGAVLYHLATGRYPFDANNQFALFNQLSRAEPPAPLPDTVPPGLAAIIAGTLTHDVGARFATADDLRAALESSGEIATHRDVAACLAEHLGDETERRRQAIEAARKEVDRADAKVVGIPRRGPVETTTAATIPRMTKDNAPTLLRIDERHAPASVVDEDQDVTKPRPDPNALKATVLRPLEAPVMPPTSAQRGLPLPQGPLPPLLIGAGTAIFVAGISLFVWAMVTKPAPAPAPAPTPVASVVVVVPPPPPPPLPVAVPTASPGIDDQARAALLRSDPAAVRRLLERKVRAGRGTPEEANMLKASCKAMQDRDCVAEVKQLYPNL